MNRKLLLLFLQVLFVTGLLSSCTKEAPEGVLVFRPHGQVEQSVHNESMLDRVFLYYAGGYNNLSNDLSRNLDTLLASPNVPDADSRNVFLVLDEIRGSRGYSVKPRPTLYRVYRDEGTLVRDTLQVFEDGFAFTTETFSQTLEIVKQTYRSKHYGMVLSSHATGWLPGGYYSNNYDKVVTKTIGDTFFRDENGKDIYYELDIRDFARCIPMKFDYILLDACLCGGVELAYELKDKCDYVGFSQTEVLAEGFNYSTMLDRIFSGSKADPEAICRDYFAQYDGTSDGATISLIDCGELDGLASVCSNLFEANRQKLETVASWSIQTYVRNSKRWCFDLRDMLDKAGVEDLSEFDTALSRCVVYSAATPYFLSIYIRSHCGLSCYLPSASAHQLDEYYRTLKWNEASGLVK